MIKLFADGGCRGNQEKNNIGSWGVYLEYGEHKKELSGTEINTTNNKMELLGVINGLKAIKNKNIPVEVYLDSAYVLNGLEQWVDNWKKNNWRTSNKKPVKNKELWIELDSVRSEFNDIKYIKVKGHSGVEGNEIADRILNAAMDNMEG